MFSYGFGGCVKDRITTRVMRQESEPAVQRAPINNGSDGDDRRPRRGALLLQRFARLLASLGTRA